MRRLAVLGAVAAAAACAWVWTTLQALPSGATLRAALDYCQIAHVAGRDYALCPRQRAFEQFPHHLVQAAIASEDRAFYSHHGVRPVAIVGALARDGLRSLAEGRIVVRQGGSTITQQFARTILLDERPTVPRKFAELLLAPQIEAMWSKHEIIAGYFNVVPHVHGLNGLDAASRYLFGVDVGKVDLAESALLIGMLPAPNLRDPAVDADAAFDAGSRVLDRMREQKMISLAQEKHAAGELHARIFDGRLVRGKDDYERLEFRPYRDFVMDELAQRNVTLPEDYRLLTNMDPRLQTWTVAETGKIAGMHQSAGVFLRPSGELLAISGSRDYAENNFNRAFKALRSIGSTGKFFPMIAAHEHAGLLQRRFPTKPLRDGRWPAEANRRCVGRLPLQYALAQSCNRPFTWLAKELGPRLTAVVERFDLKAPDSPLLVPLGGIETSPLQLARAYASMANGGQLPSVRGLVAMLGRSGRVEAAANGSASRAVMSPAIARALLADFRGPVESGTAKASNSRHAVVYGKTGTSSANHDALFVGITRDYVGAFWIGDDRPQAMAGMYGGGAPARAFARVTDAYYLHEASMASAQPARMSVFSHLDPAAPLRRFAQSHVDLVAFGMVLFLIGTYLRSRIRSRLRPRVVRVYQSIDAELRRQSRVRDPWKDASPWPASVPTKSRSTN